MHKTVKAIQPYMHPGHLNFKLPVYESWKDVGGKVYNSYFPPRIFHGLAYQYEIPNLKWFNLKQAKHEVYLMFVEPISLYFDTFPYYATHEIIPMFWDCWPQFFEKTAQWIIKHNVKAAIFTCKESAIQMKKRVPEINVFHCPEGVDSKRYSSKGKLKDKDIDLLEFGRPLFKYVKMDERLFNNFCSKIKHVRTGAMEKRPTDEELYGMMSDAKVTICYPHYITEPEWCDGLETLTQRYWECMLSGMLIVGHAPKELIDMIGYNPCIEVDFNGDAIALKVKDILRNISLYQTLADKNRETARKMSDWTLRMKDIQNWLISLGYTI